MAPLQIFKLFFTLIGVERCVCRRNAELSEMTPCLLRALLRVRLLNAEPEHRCARLLRVENAFNLAFKLEESVLAQIDLSQLQPDGFLDDNLQVLNDFIISLLVDQLVNVAAFVQNLDILAVSVLVKKWKEFKQVEHLRYLSRSCCAQKSM